MNWDNVQGNWKQFRGQVQKKWGQLTENDLDIIEGERSKLVGKLQDRYGVAKEKASEEIDRWLSDTRA